jgi:hypothetical protein
MGVLFFLFHLVFCFSRAALAMPLITENCSYFLAPADSLSTKSGNLEIMSSLAFGGRANGYLTADPYSALPDPQLPQFSKLLKADRPDPVQIRNARQTYWQPRLEFLVRSWTRQLQSQKTAVDRDTGALAKTYLSLGMLKAFLARTSSRKSPNDAALIESAIEDLRDARQLFGEVSDRTMEIFTRLQIDRAFIFEGHTQLKQSVKSWNSGTEPQAHYAEAEKDLMELRFELNANQNPSPPLVYLLAATYETLGELSMWRSWTGATSKAVVFEKRSEDLESAAVGYFLRALKILVNGPSSMWEFSVTARPTTSLFWNSVEWLKQSKIVRQPNLQHLQISVQQMSILIPRGPFDSIEKKASATEFILEIQRLLVGF